jgi:hypothetical protein
MSTSKTQCASSDENTPNGADLAKRPPQLHTLPALSPFSSEHDLAEPSLCEITNLPLVFVVKIRNISIDSGQSGCKVRTFIAPIARNCSFELLGDLLR